MKAPIALLLLGTLSGCMGYDNARVGDTGYSVYLTQYQQIADKQRAADPGEEVSATGTDGPLTERVMDGYRGVTGDARQVARPIEINVSD